MILTSHIIFNQDYLTLHANRMLHDSEPDPEPKKENDFVSVFLRLHFSK